MHSHKVTVRGNGIMFEENCGDVYVRIHWDDERIANANRLISAVPDRQFVLYTTGDHDIVDHGMSDGIHIHLVLRRSSHVGVDPA